MKMTDQIKRILSALLVLVMVFALVPVNARAASAAPVDSVAFFSDLHTSSSNSKTTLVKNTFSSIANVAASKVSAVFSVGDVFSSNESQNISSLSSVTSAIRSGLNDETVHVDYVWSDHDRYGGVANITGLVYGAGADGIYGNADDGNYYVYFISMSDMTTSPRYGITTTFTSSKLTDFTNAVATLDHTKPLFVVSHMPLLDNRGDNGHAYEWYQVISAAAENMDVALFHGHNHRYDKLTEYFYGVGDTMSVEDNGTTRKVTLNFVHACAGYMEPKSTGSYSSSTSRMEVALLVNINADSIQYVTVNANGIYTGSIGPVNKTFTRTHASAVPETPTEPTEPEVPTEPTEPQLPDTDYEWVALPSGSIYELDTDGIDAGAQYLIVAKSYAKALSAASSNNNSVNVTIDGNTVTMDSGDYGWTFASSGSNYTISNNGTYLNRSSSSLAAGSSSNTWTVSHTGNGVYQVYQSGSSSWWGSSSKNYLRWSNSNNYFQTKTSSDTVRLFKFAGSSSLGADYIRLGGEAIQNYSIADGATLDSVLAKLMVETSANGSDVNGSLAVTADMVTWSKAFNGTAAGTYIGTVTCEDKVLGSFAVVISAEHVYETVTLDATCTENGSITKTCTVCGSTVVEVIEAKGHVTETVTVEPTCTENGSVTTTCTVCGDETVEVTEAKGHVTETVTVEPTCTENGSVTTTCTVCGDETVEVIAPTGHDYTAEVTAPTCTGEGFTTYTCATCGHRYTDSYVDALGHSYKTTVTATCTEDGFEIHTCEICGHSYEGEAVAAFGHSFESTVVAPTCETEGYTTYFCTVCGHTETGNETAALGHDYTGVVTAPTCTDGGFTTYTCATCGHSYVGSETAALGHSYESVVTPPTFETEGYTTHTCTVCGDVTVDSFVPVLSHTYETVTVDATCTADGSVTHTCVDCGYSYTEILPALGHSYVTERTEATCVANGSVVTTCVTCGDTTTEVIPATGHSYEISRVEPTCTENGYLISTCPCGDVITQEIAAIGHNYQSVHTDPTCTENGSDTDTCVNCGDVKTQWIPALGHSYVTESVAPTCETEGYTTYTCATCGHSYVDDRTAALGHDYASVVTNPTCTEGGYTTYTCTLCGDSYVGNATAALGHSYTGVESDGYMVFTCACGHSYSEKLTVELEYNKVSSFAQDESYVITFYSSRKYYALSHKDNKLTAVQVKVSNNKITSEITEDLLWNYDNKKLSYTDGSTTRYLYAQSSGSWWFTSTTLTLSTTNSSEVTFSSNKLKVGSNYLRYSGNKISLNKSATTTYLFQEDEV